MSKSRSLSRRTGFLFGTLIVPRFVLAELQHIADSGDTLRRNRGKRGLDVLEELRHEEKVRMTVVDDDFEGVREVDDKLVLLARQEEARPEEPVLARTINPNQDRPERFMAMALDLTMVADAVARLTRGMRPVCRPKARIKHLTIY